MGKRGRPTKYSPEVVERFCQAVATSSASIRTICATDPELPSRTTIIRWLGEKPEFRDQYARAKEVQAFLLDDQMLEIADDARNDFVEMTTKTGKKKVMLNKEAVMRSRLRIDTRKWLLSKLLPKKYGDVKKLEVGGPDGKPVEVTLADLVRGEGGPETNGKAG